MKSLIIFILGIILFSSCNNNNGRFASEIQSVDSLQGKLLEMKEKMQNVDTSEFNEDYAAFKATHNFLLNNYPDTLDRGFWINDVNAMQRVDKAYSRFESAYKNVMEEINTTEHKLQTLRNSLEDEKLSEKEAEDYLFTEVQAVNSIEFTVYKVHPELVISERIWDSIGPGMNNLADSIRGLK